MKIKNLTYLFTLGVVLGISSHAVAHEAPAHLHLDQSDFVAFRANTDHPNTAKVNEQLHAPVQKQEFLYDHKG